ncbi:hypothetical protein ACEWPL_000760 [Roseovarius sp. S1116L3]|uniref:hypothetical protein n=1 Tax=Roseovarius roseus TaxID=3342636 RepID=UPI00372C1770
MAISIKRGAAELRRPTASALRIPEWSCALGAVMARTGAGAMRWTMSFMWTVQLSRVTKVLAEMNDRQLAAIGIARSDIPKYAESLMGDDPAAKGRHTGG